MQTPEAHSAEEELMWLNIQSALKFRHYPTVGHRFPDGTVKEIASPDFVTSGEVEFRQANDESSVIGD